MKYRNRLALLTLLLGSTLIGCAAETGGEFDEEVAATQIEDDSASRSRTLATVDVGYGEVSFHESVSEEGVVTTHVGELFPADYTSTPLDQAAGHTPLEIFMAVAPDQHVPQSLLDSHETAAANLGRGPEVIVPEFDKDAPVEKSAWSCRNFVMPSGCVGPNSYSYSHARYITATAGRQTTSLYLKKDPTFMTESSVVMGVCNEGHTSFITRIAWDNDGDANHSDSDMYNAAWVTIPAGHRYRWLGLNQSVIGWNYGTPIQSPTRYRLDVSAATYGTRHLQSALVTPTSSGCIR